MTKRYKLQPPCTPLEYINGVRERHSGAGLVFQDSFNPFRLFYCIEIGKRFYEISWDARRETGGETHMTVSVSHPYNGLEKASLMLIFSRLRGKRKLTPVLIVNRGRAEDLVEILHNTTPAGRRLVQITARKEVTSAS